jgi:hypothetical protein
MPDNGLANLAGALLAQGKHVEIIDYCTVSTVRRMTSPDLQRRLSRAWESLRRGGGGPLGSLRRLAMLPALQRGERERRHLQNRTIGEIGEELVARVKDQQIDAVGFKLWNGDGLEGAGRLATTLRRNCPHLRIFGGGPHVDLFMEAILQTYPAFDALVYGEGEETIQHLAAAGGTPDAFGSIPNLFYSLDGTPHRTQERMVDRLDTLPLPVYDPAIYPAMKGDEKVKVIVIDESRGCRNNCVFCIHPVKSHRQVRVKSIARLIEEVRRLEIQYSLRAFRFAGSCTPYSLLNDFAGELVRQNISLRYASFAHIRESDDANFPLLKQSGCQALFFGIESGSQRILDAMRKGITVEQVRKAIRQSHQAGIFTVGSLIFPAPGEDQHSERETMGLIQQIPLDSLMLQAPVVIPRTAWFETPEQFGITFHDKARYLKTALTWKVKLQLPPRFWDGLPIRYDGRPFDKVLTRTGAFARAAAGLGIPTSISDETYLMSVEAGMPARDFRDQALAAFYSGDGGAISDLVGRINSGAGSR